MSLFKNFLILVVFFNLFNCFNCADWSQDTLPDKWNKYAKERIESVLNSKNNYNVAKNVILFLGDGMGVSTITAGRILKGQMKGQNGEEEVTNLESLDHSALVKTYGVDAQTSDSAGTATAYLCGIKTRMGVIGLDGRAAYNKCKGSNDYNVESILKWANRAGKSTGFVTTTRITTPAGTYANTADREWEAFDGKVFTTETKNDGCKDIADQFVDNSHIINVAFGGGRRKFMKNTESDYYDKSKKGDRVDNRNLIEEWSNKMSKLGKKHKFIWNITDLESLKQNEHDHILGMFSHSHMNWETQRKKDPTVEPSLTQMTQKAIELLSVNKNGFFLLVEGGNIDNGHHESKAKKALNEFIAFDDAIGKALQMISTDDTLLVVTADHSHVFTMGSYAVRGNPILGVAVTDFGNFSTNNVTYTSLNYGNGPGGPLAGKLPRDTDLDNSIIDNDDYIQEAAVHIDSETHGGEDVAIFAKGPMSHLFDGAFEQNLVAHVMAYSACIGPYNLTNYPKCFNNRGGIPDSTNQSNETRFSYINILILCSITCFFLFL